MRMTELPCDTKYDGLIDLLLRIEEQLNNDDVPDNEMIYDLYEIISIVCNCDDDDEYSLAGMQLLYGPLTDLNILRLVLEIYYENCHKLDIDETDVIRTANEFMEEL